MFSRLHFCKSLLYGRERLFCVRLNYSQLAVKTSDSESDPNTSNKIIQKRPSALDLLLNASNIKEEWSEEELRLKEKAERENAWLVGNFVVFGGFLGGGFDLLWEKAKSRARKGGKQRT
ncbi:unnamed protein product [Meloidogyne enterolobii]|uniref:Uncharacterized protein n=1 Tax=Meloidogyne enterolobii TaxID=390850 RepID=A0ACB0YVI7_MELEN